VQKVSAFEQRQAAAALTAAEVQRRLGVSDLTSPESYASRALDPESGKTVQSYNFGAAGQAAGALKAQQQAIGFRIRQLRKALATRGHTKAAKARWQTELAQLLPQHADLARQRSALVHGYGVKQGVIDDEDGDPNQALIDAIAAAAEEQQRIWEEQKAAQEAHTAALTAVQGEIKRQTDFGQAVMTTENFQLKKMIGDLVGSGLGASVTQKSFTPGYGQIASY
jgi:hypothetical protein